jgi:hypothetical protein
MHTIPPIVTKAANATAHAAVNTALHPIQSTAAGIHQINELRKRNRHFIVGAVFMVSGSAFGRFGPIFISSATGHLFVDVVAYLVHGIGTAPFAYHIIRRFALEPQAEKKVHRSHKRKTHEVHAGEGI